MGYTGPSSSSRPPAPAIGDPGTSSGPPASSFCVLCGRNPSTLKGNCQHNFCANCIVVLLRRNLTRTLSYCPVCRPSKGSSATSSGPRPSSSSSPFCASCLTEPYMLKRKCGHAFCASCILNMLPSDLNSTLSRCPKCSFPLTFLDPLKDESAALHPLIKKYNAHYSGDIRTRVHQENGSEITSGDAPKLTKLFQISWKITEAADKNNPSTRVLSLVKPANSGMNFPVVSFKREDSYNHHRFKIMYYLNHENLLHMLAADHCSHCAGSFDTFVEPTLGMLISICDISSCVDDIGHIPSLRFQSIVRQIFKAIEFLREHLLYHGNLRWTNSLFAHPYTVKLAGFMSQAMTIEQAQFHDRKCLANMLRDQLNFAIQYPRHGGSQIFYAHLNGLIRVLEREDLALRDNTENIIGHTFFWDEGRRTDFYTTVVSLRIKDERFQFFIHHCEICAMPWSKSNNRAYLELLKTMNEYRKNNNMKLYDFNCPVDFLRCVCGAYTHRHVLGRFKIDRLIRQAHPALSILMKRLVETFDSSGFECNDKTCSTCKVLWRLPQMRKFVEEKYSRGP